LSFGASRRTFGRVASERLSSPITLSPHMTARATRGVLENVDLLVCDMAGTVVQEGGLVYRTLQLCMQVADDEMHPWHGAKKEAVIEHFARKVLAVINKALVMSAAMDSAFWEFKDVVALLIDEDNGLATAVRGSAMSNSLKDASLFFPMPVCFKDDAANEHFEMRRFSSVASLFFPRWRPMSTSSLSAFSVSRQHCPYEKYPNAYAAGGQYLLDAKAVRILTAKGLPELDLKDPYPVEDHYVASVLAAAGVKATSASLTVLPQWISCCPEVLSDSAVSLRRCDADLDVLLKRGFNGSFLALMSLLFSILAGNSYSSLYGQNEAIFCALFAEVSEAKALMEQIALVCSGRPFYRSALENIRRYVNNDLKRLDKPPSVLCALKPRDDPLESILYLTSVGVPSAVYETVRSLRQRRGDRLGAVQR
ncbi:unnamed protein product, partial [Polarella glacialis]